MGGLDTTGDTAQEADEERVGVIRIDSPWILSCCGPGKHGTRTPFRTPEAGQEAGEAENSRRSFAL
ncbi:MAG: hypothetical protein K0S14_251 [Thermomicrobiales bacterium]|jgi:hypothetical protein|nr:hypothetical protein [Thermomicrobiales bacterium]